MVQNTATKRNTNTNQRVLYFLGVSPDREKELLDTIFGKKMNPVEELIRERMNSEDTEAIYEAGMCWTYECGALITAMKMLDFNDSDIIKILKTMDYVQENDTAKNLAEIYERFLEDIDE